MKEQQNPPSWDEGVDVEWIYAGNANDANNPLEPYIYVNAQTPGAQSDFDPNRHGTVGNKTTSNMKKC